MKLPFRQGIVRQQKTGAGTPNHLAVSAGNFIDLIATNTPTSVTFAHGSSNYFLNEFNSVTRAWGPFTAGTTDFFLYWDIDTRTGLRTFGSTTVEPQYGPSLPTSAVDDLHFFDTTNFKMRVYNASANVFVERIRVFAGVYRGGATLEPYSTGSQVNLNNTNQSGEILFDDTGRGVRKKSGEFFTVEDQFIRNGARGEPVRLDASVIPVVADETLAAFQVVAVTGFDRIAAGTYEDVEVNSVGIITENVLINSPVNMVVQGAVFNPNWDWKVPNADLFISDGFLSENDPNIVDPLSHPRRRMPVARVLDAQTIIFMPGLVGLNIHTHPATEIIVTPNGNISSINAQLALQELDSEKVARAGDSMVAGANLTFSSGGEVLGLPLVPSGDTAAASKAYVDSIAVQGGVVVQDEGLTVAGGPHTTLNFVGLTVDATDAGGGTANVTITAGGGTPTTLIDADADTKVDVEESADDDTVRIDVGDTPAGYGAVADILTLASSGWTVNMGTANVAATAGAPITFTAGGGNTTGTGGNVTFTAGTAGATAAGGALVVAGGPGGATSGPGGSATLQGGNAVGGGTGGAANVIAGTGASTGGTVTITAGNAGTSGSGGAVNITGGTALGTSQSGGGVTLAGGALQTTSGGIPGAVRLFGGTSQSTFVNGGQVLIQGGFAAAQSNGGPIDIITRNGGATTGSGGAITIQTGNATTQGQGGNMTIVTGDAVGSSVNGGTLSISTGAGGAGGGGGGDILVQAGAGTNQPGGDLSLTAGAATGTSFATGGNASITAGNGATGGGSVTITAGNATSGDNVGGAVTITAGNAFGSAAGGAVNITGGTGGNNAGAGPGGTLGGDINITGGTAGTSSDGGSIFIVAGPGDHSGEVSGGNVTIRAGDGGASGPGDVIVEGGHPGPDAANNAGDVTIRGGQGSFGGATANGGNLNLQGGAAAIGQTGGDVTLQGGQGSSGVAGNVTISGGIGPSQNQAGTVSLESRIYRTFTLSLSDNTPTVVSIPLASSSFGIAYAYEVIIVGHDRSTNESFLRKLAGLAKSKNGTELNVGTSPTEVYFQDDSTGWTATVGVNDGTNSLDITITSDATDAVDWKMSVMIIQDGF